MLISVETDSMNNFINRGFFFKLLIGLTFHFFLSIAWEKTEKVLW